jgi:Mitochondrial carrier protein
MSNILHLTITVVSQAGRAASDQAYKGIIDCAVRVFREEGAITFYRGLPPRLVSVVPMIAIQFTVYEFMKRVMIQRRIVKEEAQSLKRRKQPSYDDETVLEEAMMGVAASQAHPNPVPRFSKPAEYAQTQK